MCRSGLVQDQTDLKEIFASVPSLGTHNYSHIASRLLSHKINDSE